MSRLIILVGRGSRKCTVDGMSLYGLEGQRSLVRGGWGWEVWELVLGLGGLFGDCGELVVRLDREALIVLLERNRREEMGV